MLPCAEPRGPTRRSSEQQPHAGAPSRPGRAPLGSPRSPGGRSGSPRSPCRAPCPVSWRSRARLFQRRHRPRPAPRVSPLRSRSCSRATRGGRSAHFCGGLEAPAGDGGREGGREGGGEGRGGGGGVTIQRPLRAVRVGRAPREPSPQRHAPRPPPHYQTLHALLSRVSSIG